MLLFLTLHCLSNNFVMFSLTPIDNILLLTQKRCGLVVEKSFIAGIHINDEVIEINHIKVELLNNADVKRYLSGPNITLLICQVIKNN